MKLETGFWFTQVLGGEVIPDDELAEIWQEHRDALLAEYSPPSWSPDRPAWGQYIFDLVPVHGPRCGIDLTEPNGGYNVEERDAEPWGDYLRRCGVAR
jgi:hypothetical protein